MLRHNDEPPGPGDLLDIYTGDATQTGVEAVLDHGKSDYSRCWTSGMRDRGESLHVDAINNDFEVWLESSINLQQSPELPPL